MFVCLCLSVCVCLSVCLSVYAFVSICLSLYVCVSVCLSTYVCVSVCPCMSVCLSVCLSVYVCPCMSVCLSVCLSVSVCPCMSVCLYMSVYVLLGTRARVWRSQQSRDQRSVPLWRQSSVVVRWQRLGSLPVAGRWLDCSQLTFIIDTHYELHASVIEHHEIFWNTLASGSLENCGSGSVLSELLLVASGNFEKFVNYIWVCYYSCPYLPLIAFLFH